MQERSSTDREENLGRRNKSTRELEKRMDGLERSITALAVSFEDKLNQRLGAFEARIIGLLK